MNQKIKALIKAFLFASIVLLLPIIFIPEITVAELSLMIWSDFLSTLKSGNLLDVLYYFLMFLGVLLPVVGAYYYVLRKQACLKEVFPEKEEPQSS